MLAAASALSTGALGQSPGRTYVVGFWGYRNLMGPPLPQVKWFEDGLAKHGFVVGRNLRIEYVFTGQDSIDLIPDQARALVARNPDVIHLAVGTRGERDAIRALDKSIPITFANVVEDAVLRDLGDLKHPAKNMTGVALKYAELSEKRLEIVRDLLPNARRVVVITDADAWGPSLGRIQDAGRRIGLEVTIGDVSRHGGGMKATVEAGNAALAAILTDMLKSRPDAFMAYGAFNASERFRKFPEFELKHRIPFIGDGAESARGVVGYGMDYKDHFEHLFAIIAKILRGTRPADIPVDSTSRFLLTVDLKRAKEIGLVIPPAILVRADKVIQ